MRVHPLIYKSPRAYPAFYLMDSEAEKRMITAITIIQGNIQKYTHEDVLRFLTDKNYRRTLIKKAEKSGDYQLKANCQEWWSKYEKEIGKKSWWYRTVSAVEELTQAEEVKAPQPGSIEAQIYEVVKNSRQYLIPIIYHTLQLYEDPGSHAVVCKDELLARFDVLGLEYCCTSSMIGSCVNRETPFLVVKTPGLPGRNKGRRWKGVIEVFLQNPI